MKKLVLALLVPMTFWISGPSALAEDLTPTSIALAPDTKIVTEDSSLKAQVPDVDDGNMATGVDIVNQSLQYHSSVNPQIPTQNSIHNSMMQGSNQMSLQGGLKHNSYGNMGATSNMMPQQQYGYMGAQNQMQGTNNMYQMRQPQSGMMMPQVSGDTMKKAIGVVGTAALVGVFVKSGGLGGLTRSMGWDNHRYMRGNHR